MTSVLYLRAIGFILSAAVTIGASVAIRKVLAAWCVPFEMTNLNVLLNIKPEGAPWPPPGAGMWIAKLKCWPEGP